MNNFKLTEDEILLLWKLEENECFLDVDKVVYFCSLSDKDYDKFINSLYFSLTEKHIFSWCQIKDGIIKIKLSNQGKLIMKLIYVTLPKEERKEFSFLKKNI